MSPAQNKERDIHYYLDLVDLVRDGIVCTDARARILLVNYPAASMFGYAPEEFLGASLQMLYKEEDRIRCGLGVVNETLEHGSYEGEFLFQRKDGNSFPGYLHSATIQYEDDSKDLVFLIQDLGEQRTLQKQLLDSQKMASLGRVVEGISHEIRNPITSVGGHVRRLKKTLEPDHPGHRELEIVLDDVKRMEQMLEEITDYVDFSTVRRPSFMRLDLQNVLKDALRSVPLPRSIQLQESFPPRGPWIYGDPAYLRELFIHLLKNAIEAMPDGGLLRTSAQQEDAHVSVEIQDTGVGITDDDLSNIFNPFFTTKTKGAGVGLSKAYIIVEEHGGLIDVRSEPNAGATFRIFFPTDRRQRVRRNERL